MNLGYAREIDSLGRIVLPKQMRNKLGLVEKSVVEITLDEENEVITLRRSDPRCALCSSQKQLVPFKTRQLCSDCLRDLGNLK